MIPAARLWAAAPAALLITLIGTQLAVLQAVLHDPSFAIEPDYYQKAVDWDARTEEQRQGVAEGWTTDLALSQRGRLAELRVALTEATGAAITGARLSVTAFHNARASETQSVALEESTPGSYRGALAVTRPGLWELRVLVETRGVRYVTVFRRDLLTASHIRFPEASR